MAILLAQVGGLCLGGRPRERTYKHLYGSPCHGKAARGSFSLSCEKYTIKKEQNEAELSRPGGERSSSSRKKKPIATHMFVPSEQQQG